MKKFSFDKLPSIVQHIVIAFAGAAGFVIVDAISKAGGVIGLNWGHVLISALNAGSVSAAGIAGLLWITPLTHQYGFNASPLSNDGDSVADVATDPVTPPHK